MAVFSRLSIKFVLIAICIGAVVPVIVSAATGSDGWQLWAIMKAGEADCTVMSSPTPPSADWMRNHIYSAQKSGYAVQYYVCGKNASACGENKRNAIHRYCRMQKRIPPATFNINN